MTTADELPALFPTRYTRPASNTWQLAAIEPLPPGWVNVRIWSYDYILGVNLWVTDASPGLVHEDNNVTEHVLSWADSDGEIVCPEFGYLYDEYPVVVATTDAEPPWQRKHFADPDWRPAYLGGGYLGSCPADLVPDVLAEHGMSDAVPRPDDWQPDDSENE